jgi:phospholipid/cholesterol/gamma-HCH transport system substrate-binding protein
MRVFAEDPRFQGLERRTGLFVLFALLIVGALIFGVLVRQGAFTKTTPLSFLANSAQGIAKGMAVQLSGFKVGTVDSLGLQSDGAVKVKLAVLNDYMRLITRDSVARLSKEGLIGESVIEIVPGRAGSQRMQPGGSLKFERAADIGVIAQSLSEQVRPILADLKEITESIKSPEGDIHSTIHNAKLATAELAQAAAQMNRLAQQSGQQLAGVLAKADKAIAHVDQAIAAADGAIGRADAVLEHAGSTLAAVQGTLPQLMLKLDRTLDKLDAVAEDAKKVTASAAEELPPAMRDARAAAEDGRAIVRGAKRAWPISSFVAEPREQALPVDSFDGPAPR